MFIPSYSVSLGDSLPADPGEAQAVADWAASTANAVSQTALNAGVYIPATSGIAAPVPFSAWLSQNSTVIVAGCALLGLLLTARKR